MNIQSHWQIQTYFTFSAIRLTDLLILDEVILLLVFLVYGGY